MPELGLLTGALDEPFDGTMAIPRCMYLAAHRRGLKVMLDGSAGDLVLGAGAHLRRLARSGHFVRAYRERVDKERRRGERYTRAGTLLRVVIFGS